jgi:hypothetical protein
MIYICKIIKRIIIRGKVLFYITVLDYVLVKKLNINNKLNKHETF